MSIKKIISYFLPHSWVPPILFFFIFIFIYLFGVDGSKEKGAFGILIKKKNHVGWTNTIYVRSREKKDDGCLNGIFSKKKREVIN